ncbi:hypothetical protein HDU98_010926 [Podochytrium sp. JEL0797]|nr:hypothetical protein HDU98_010926 [Podochytrium sp. JEL0797]
MLMSLVKQLKRNAAEAAAPPGHDGTSSSSSSSDSTALASAATYGVGLGRPRLFGGTIQFGEAPPIVLGVRDDSRDDTLCDEVVDDTLQADAPRDEPVPPPSPASLLPAELLALVFLFVSAAKDRRELALVCWRWHAVVTPMLWNSVAITSPSDLQRFLVCAIHTTTRASGNPAILAHIDHIRNSQLLTIADLPKVDMAALNNPAAAVPTLIHALQPHLLNNPNNNPILLQLHNNLVNNPDFNMGQQHQNMMNDMVVENNNNANANNHPHNNPILANIMNMMQFALATSTTSRLDAEAQQDSAVSRRDADSEMIDVFNRITTERKSFGSAEYVRKLSIPTFDCRVNLLGLLNELLPNLTSIHFQHIHADETSGGPYTATFTPVSGPLLRTLSPLVSRATRLAIEDVYPTSWSDILSLLSNPGATTHLRSLNLEAVSTTDSFDSPQKLSTVFPHLPRLEAARFDGIALGPDTSILQLTRWCPFLKVVALDYCPNVTMKSFEVLWNGLDGLYFLGLAGIMNEQQHLHHPNHHHFHDDAGVSGGEGMMQLKRHEKIRIVRLVDCDVSDELFEKVCASGVGLEMLRFVFEDDECDGILGIVERLSERTLVPYGEAYMGGETGVRKGLKKLAFTWCPGFTGESLKRVLEYGWGKGGKGGVEVLDLHKDVNCTLGEIPAEVLEECVDSFGHLKVLNLYGQTKLTDETLQFLFTPTHFPSLTSLCINDSQVTLPTLRQIIVTLPTLTSLSVIQCPHITLQDLQTLFNEIPVEMARIRRLYTLHCWNADANPSKEEGGVREGISLPFSETSSESGDDDDEDDDEMVLDRQQQGTSSSFGGASGIMTPPSVSAVREGVSYAAITAGKTKGPTAKVNGRDVPDVEPICVIHDDMWFVDEGLDIMSLFNGSVAAVTDIRG